MYTSPELYLANKAAFEGSEMAKEILNCPIVSSMLNFTPFLTLVYLALLFTLF